MEKARRVPCSRAFVFDCGCLVERRRTSGYAAASDKRSESVQRETELDRHQHRDRLAEPHAGTKTKLLRGLERFLVEAEGLIERSHDAGIRTLAVCLDYAFDPDGALNAGAHRVGRILRLRNVG